MIHGHVHLKTKYKVAGEFDNPYLNAVALWFSKELKRARKIDYSKFSIEKDIIGTLTDSIENPKLQVYHYQVILEALLVI
ncbi:hypothetical protein ACYSNM_11325 [Myroides sp. LJL116]